MNDLITIKINFRGGIISPGYLYNILVAATRAGIIYCGFGLRQQLLIHTASSDKVKLFTRSLDELGVFFEVDNDAFPNITSSYPAEEVFINNTWLSEGVYKDIFDGMQHRFRLKVNVSDSNQSFTPMLTGNINWVAASGAPHFWHLFIRFPKTNTVYEWTDMVYTNDVAQLSIDIETLILQNRRLFYDNPEAKGDELFSRIDTAKYITRAADKPAALPLFNLPYYEGLNRYNNKYWLGIYRRDELYSMEFLKELCKLCLDTKIGLLCSTPWKTIIVKGIEEKDKDKWSFLLEKYNINMRHAANELNFQVEDNSSDALALKEYLVKQLNDDDIRTFGICIGIKTKKKTEIFSSILVRRRPLLSFWGIDFFYVYDILCAKDFNPNERTGRVLSSYNLKMFLGYQLKKSILSFLRYRTSIHAVSQHKAEAEKEEKKNSTAAYIHQCKNCLSVYDEKMGEPLLGIEAGTPFENLPAHFTCAICESSKADFAKKDMAALTLQAI